MGEMEINTSDSLHLEYQPPSSPTLSILPSSRMSPFSGGSPISQVGRVLLEGLHIPGAGPHVPASLGESSSDSS